MPEPEVHAIILDAIDELQGENVTGTGSLETLKTRTITAHEWAEHEPATENTEACGTLLSNIASQMQGGFTTADVAAWAGDLHEANEKCP